MDASGIVSVDRLREAITDDTALVSIMHANNEIGTVQPIAELAAVAHERGALFHTDAVQSAGKLPVDVRALGVDLLSIAAHKFYGPKGAGALWVKRGVRMLPFMTGGRQERNRRAGTENVPALVGLGVAAEVARRKIDTEGAASGRAARSTRGGHPVVGAGHRSQRRRRAARAEHDQHQRRARRSGVVADRPRPRRHRGVVRIGVLVGHARTVARVEGDGLSARPDARLDSLQPRDEQYRQPTSIACSRPCRRLVEKLRSLTTVGGRK